MTSGADGKTLPEHRQAGVCLHITSLPGAHGIGEIGEQAYRFVDAMTRMQLGVWQFLPTGPTAFGDSPYQPLSTFAGNELFIDVADLVHRGLLNGGEVSSLHDLPADFVDYGQLIAVKNRLLARAAGRFSEKANAADKAALDDFLQANDEPWLNDYAMFRILKSQHGELPWPQWDADFVHREISALRRLQDAAGARIDEIKILQFLFHQQWNRLRNYAHEAGVRLFGDMPICIALDSADAWANRDLLRIDEDGRPDAVAGVPPDYFSADGQLWGNPLYDWKTHAATGYAWWIERLRASAGLADIVRIDHFRGFESYWSVPANATNARLGAWEPGPGDAIFDAMRDALGQLPIVAEDLGVITPEVEALRDRHQIPGMVVMQFDVTEADFDIDDVEENVVCYTGTHDNNTTLGWFHGGGDIRAADEVLATQKAVLEITGGTPETIHLDLIRLAFSTGARLAIAPMQDYLGLGSEARLNTPGTSRNNWRWRLLDSQLTDDLCDNTAEMVHAADRDLVT
jgi:4-alpha-glucanotransferase